jgi:hypothetical protein
MHIAQIVDARFLLKLNACHVRVLSTSGIP